VLVGGSLVGQHVPLAGHVQGVTVVVVGHQVSGGDVHQPGDADPTGVVRVACPVGLAQGMDAEYGVPVFGAAGLGGEHPVRLAVDDLLTRGGHGQRDPFVHTHEPAGYADAVGPGAGTIDRQAVPSGLGRAVVAPVGGDPVVEGRRIALALLGGNLVGTHLGLPL